MLAADMIWEFLPKGLKDVFKIVNVERQSSAFHVWLDELRQKSYEDRHNHSIVGKGYTEYCTPHCGTSACLVDTFRLGALFRACSRF